MFQRWDPFREMERMTEAMDRLWDGGAWRPRRLLRPFFTEGDVIMDVYRTADDLVIKASLPGIKPEDVSITVEGNTLTISGQHRAEHEEKEHDYLLREFSYGAFSRSIPLPTGLKTDKAEATFEHGVLTLTIPRSEAEKPKTVQVKVKSP